MQLDKTEEKIINEPDDVLYILPAKINDYPKRDKTSKILSSNLILTTRQLGDKINEDDLVTENPSLCTKKMLILEET